MQASQGIIRSSFDTLLVLCKVVLDKLVKLQCALLPVSTDFRTDSAWVAREREREKQFHGCTTVLKLNESFYPFSTCVAISRRVSCLS